MLKVREEVLNVTLADPAEFTAERPIEEGSVNQCVMAR